MKRQRPPKRYLKDYLFPKPNWRCRIGWHVFQYWPTQHGNACVRCGLIEE